MSENNNSKNAIIVTSQPNSTNQESSKTNSADQYIRRAYVCPPGIEYLLEIDQLLVQQRFKNFRCYNQYAIKNSMGQQVFLAKEDQNTCAVFCCGNNRPFKFRLLDISNREVMHVSRPLGCADCCFPCCLHCLTVEAPPGNTIGYVEQDFSFCYPKFSVKNSLGDRVLRIEGPLCTFSLLFNDIEFPVYSIEGDNVEVARITKQWSGFWREMCTVADNYGVVFPMDLDVNIKACLLAAVFLIDFMFFEYQH